MSRQPLRYFVNEMDDWVEGFGREVEVDTQRWVKEAFDYVQKIIQNFSPTLQNCDGGLYVGAAGVGYTLWYLSTKPAFASQKAALLGLAKKYVDVSFQYIQHPDYKDDGIQVSLILGNGGVYLVGALVFHSLGLHDQVKQCVNAYEKLAEKCLLPRFLRCGSDELFVGRAGYLAGLLVLRNKLGVKVLNDGTVHEICKLIVESGRHYAAKTKSKVPLMYAYYDTEYLGAAHGLCSILQMLLSFPGFVSAYPDYVADVRSSVMYLQELETMAGNYPCAIDETGANARPEEHDLVHWCHGAPGTIYMLARAYRVYLEDDLKQGCLRAGDLIWKKGLLKKGPGICHGVAGNAYAFLLNYRLTGNQKHLYRAQKFAEFLSTDQFKSKARTPDSPWSLYEGVAGTACFLADLTDPANAEFPLFDVMF